jgi:hypothetical protein
MRTLRPGSLGDDVKVWQGFLVSKGLYEGKLDGQFGARTLEATQRFQRQNALGDDGLVGNGTYGVALQQGLELAHEDPPLPGGDISRGDAWSPPQAPPDASLVIARDPRVITNHLLGQLPCPNNPAPPVGYAYWKGGVSAAVQAFASKVEGHAADFPMGSFVQTTLDGNVVAARVEWHDFQGMTGKTGCFRGTSLFRPRA